MLLIIDNQSAYIKRFKRDYLNEYDIPYKVFDHNEPVRGEFLTDIKGVILSGGRGNPYQPLNLTANFVALMRFDVPVIGFCLSHEIIAVAYGGHIRKLPEYHGRKELITITSLNDPIFNGLTSSQVALQKKHAWHVSQIPDVFEVLAHSEACPFEVIKHKEKPLYGFQAHPEVSGKDGMQIMKNFISLCGIDPQ
jgi:GMP synthase (glutamine-hydrolysing)